MKLLQFERMYLQVSISRLDTNKWLNILSKWLKCKRERWTSIFFHLSFFLGGCSLCFGVHSIDLFSLYDVLWDLCPSRTFSLFFLHLVETIQNSRLGRKKENFYLFTTFLQVCVGLFLVSYTHNQIQILASLHVYFSMGKWQTIFNNKISTKS